MISTEASASPARRKKRERILVAASELFGKHGFSSALVDDIAREAGVAKGTVYNHFGSKEALYRQVITTRLEHLVSVLEESCRQRDDVRLNVRRVAVHVMSFMLKYPAFFRIWKREEGRVCGEAGHPLHKLRSELHSVLVEVLERGSAVGLIRQADHAATAALVFGTIDGAVYRSLSCSVDDPRIRAERDMLDEFVWRAVGVDGQA